ncbi:MAG: M24 family metallopeptidase, partial [Phycisphaerae bacterium]
MTAKTYRLFAGIPLQNNALYHQIRFGVGDPAALIIASENGGTNRHLIIRDIEMERARKRARVDTVASPADFTPVGGLSGDRETATAQSVAEFLRRAGAKTVTVDRTLPFYFAHEIREAGIALEYDADMGVLERRQKDENEIEHLQQAQRDTEQVVQWMCEIIGRATAAADGVLQHEGAPLTAERAFSMIDIELLRRGYGNPHGSIVAGGSEGGDCHTTGRGPLRVNEPVIVDIFPINKATKSVGDCTRVVVNGTPTDEWRKMHAAVVAAKAAAMSATRAGTTG